MKSNCISALQAKNQCQIRHLLSFRGCDYYSPHVFFVPHVSIRCWGSRSTVVPGKYSNIASSGEQWCALSTKGEVRCSSQLTKPAPKMSFKNLAGGSGQFCGVAKDETVRCWGNSAKPLVPPAKLKARYLVVGRNFSCAANVSRNFECFGSEAPEFSGANITVKDLAAGDDFVCVLIPAGKDCFSKPGTQG